jgi:hypothetical protein
MQRLNVILLLIVLLGISKVSSGNTIDDVSVQTDNKTTVIINGTFSDGCERDLIPLTTSLEDSVIIQIFTQQTSDNCSEEEIPFISKNEITPPDKDEYLITALLYDGLPGQPETVQLLDYEVLVAENKTDDTDNDTDNGTDNGTTEEFIVTVNLTPETLNLKSQGRWITAKIEVTGDKSNDDIDIESIKLEETIKVEQSSLSSGELMVKFNRSEVISLIEDMDIDPPETVELTISGNFTGDNETSFEATDTIRVINPGKGKGNK